MANKERVLVVDDDADARELLRTALGQAGYSAESARDGFEALARLRADPADLVLSDVRMPGMSGLELIRALHEQGQHPPVVLMTGADTHDLCTGAEAYGASACLPKPLRMEELL